jgi:gas vesicle protein
MSKITSFLSGALLGVAVGAITALLLTPLSGEELQEQARDQWDTMWEDARRAADEKRAQLEEELAKLKKEGVAES